ncbi:unnamed protein product [Meganyctiphanes norvegica]|uniref:Condensation domain-containing protein n=1 Tax=Meganyctiphanes norvegica TaxID=48144 RepID=A0AAV2Q2A4_MEGNR
MSGTLVWQRPLWFMEEFWVAANKRGTRSTLAALRLDSCKPLQESHVCQALTHLYRKIPTLRLCIRQHGGQLWFAERSEIDVPLKVIFNKTREECLQKLYHQQYNLDIRPPWRTMLVCDPKGSTNSKYPHRYHLLFNQHHAITDGITCNTIFAWFTILLNQVISGENIENSVQIGYHASADQTLKQLKYIEDEIRIDKNENDTKMKNNCNKDNFPLLLQAFPGSKECIDTTHCIEKEINKETTSIFFRKCKENMVTVNSAVTYITGCAAVDLLASSGIKNDHYNLQLSHQIDLRRYWKGDISKALGDHAFAYRYDINVPRKWESNFWNSIQGFNEDYKTKLENRDPLKQMLLNKRNIPMSVGNGPPLINFSISNCGVMPLPQNCEHVILTQHTIHNPVHNFNLPGCLFFMTFKDKFMLSFPYSSHHFCKAAAEGFMNNIVEIIHDIAENK